MVLLEKRRATIHSLLREESGTYGVLRSGIERQARRSCDMEQLCLPPAMRYNSNAGPMILPHIRRFPRLNHVLSSWEGLMQGQNQRISSCDHRGALLVRCAQRPPHRMFRRLGRIRAALAVRLIDCAQPPPFKPRKVRGCQFLMLLSMSFVELYHNHSYIRQVRRRFKRGG
jgi:hypothetical protein